MSLQGCLATLLLLTFTNYHLSRLLRTSFPTCKLRLHHLPALRSQVAFLEHRLLFRKG